MGSSKKTSQKNFSDWLKHTNTVVVPNHNRAVLQSELNEAYMSALYPYISSVHVSATLDPLCRPYYHFCLKESVTEPPTIYTLFPFPNEYNQPIRELTSVTFPLFLKNVCGIHDPDSTQLSDLYKALVQLIQKWPLTPQKKILESIKYSKPHFALWLMSNPSYIYADGNNNLYFDSQPYGNTLHIPIDSPRYRSILCLSSNVLPKANLSKSYFSLFEKEALKPHNQLDFSAIKNSLFFRIVLDSVYMS